jgi:phosphoribosylanthranilate isomerase
MAMSVVVKICGLSTPETLEAALTAGVDLVGFVFVAKSPRYIDIDAARSLGIQTGGRAKKVALLVDPDDRTVAQVLNALNADFLQLHGQESPERVSLLRRQAGVPIIKAVGVAAAADLAAIRPYLGIADRILIDAKPPAAAAYPGGHGASFDWSILTALEPGLPFILSGGLNPENVMSALARVRPWGIDVSSGVERAPGQKDNARIAQFVANARRGALPLKQPMYTPRAEE